MKLIKIFFILIIFSATSCLKTIPIQESQNKEIFQEQSKEQSQEEPQVKYQEKQYVNGTDDIPLLLGLSLIEEDSSSFDAILGNIVISKYRGNLNLDVVKDFYIKTLPQLGWVLNYKKGDKISFIREEDKLEIKMEYIQKMLYVRFFILSAMQ